MGSGLGVDSSLGEGELKVGYGFGEGKVRG